MPHTRQGECRLSDTKILPPKTPRCAAKDVCNRKNHKVLTRNGAAGGHCQLRSQSLPPLQCARMWERARTTTHLRMGVVEPWEARGGQSVRGDRGGWMNVGALRPKPTRCGHGSWTRVVDRVSSLPGQELPASLCSRHSSSPAPPAVAMPLLNSSFEVGVLECVRPPLHVQMNRVRGLSHQLVKTPFVGISNCNSVKSGGPTSISQHTFPNNCTVGISWKVWCDWGMSLSNNRLTLSMCQGQHSFTLAYQTPVSKPVFANVCDLPLRYTNKLAEGLITRASSDTIRQHLRL